MIEKLKHMETKRTYSVKDLQDYLGIGRTTAYELVNSKGFPAFRIGKKILVNAEGLEEWIKKGGTISNESYN